MADNTGARMDYTILNKTNKREDKEIAPRIHPLSQSFKGCMTRREVTRVERTIAPPSTRL